MIDVSKSLEELENDRWLNYDFPTPLVEKCHRYRKIPLKDLTIEQLRLLIGQNIGLAFLIPKAIEILNQDILAEGDLYKGDLLIAVIMSEDSFWQTNSSSKRQVQKLITERRLYIESLNSENAFRQLLRKIESFNLK